jgi:hypothetical protein
MRDSAAVLSPYADIIAATALRTRGSLPPVCPPPGHHGRKRPAPSPSCPRIPPGVRALTPLPTSVDHGQTPNPRTNVLPKRRRWS